MSTGLRFAAAAAFLAGAAGLAACGHNMEQRAATGAGAGLLVGGPVGAAVGAGVGAAVDTVEDSQHDADNKITE